MSRQLLVAAIAFVLFLGSFAPAYSQTDVLSIQFGDVPGRDSVQGSPGSTVRIPVWITGVTGTMPTEAVEITVPSPLQVLDTSTCIAETVMATENASIITRPCQVVGWSGSDGAEIISARIDGLSSYTGFKITMSLQVRIPETAAIGSSYTISAPNKYFAAYRDPSYIILSVVSNSATTTSNAISNTASTSPRSAPAITIQEPLHDIDGSELKFVVGSIKPFSFELSYDTFSEATSATLSLYSDDGWIEVSDHSVVDLRASYACYEDPTTEYNPPRKPKKTIDVLPSVFNLHLGRWMQPGTEIQVCAEVVYYNGTKVLGVERHRSVILVKE